MRVLLALVIVAPVCLLVAYVMRAQTQARTQPSRDLARAVRLLDRVAEADTVMPYLSSETREEVRAFLRRYHGREIGR